MATQINYKQIKAEADLYKYQIVPSISSWNLTVALKNYLWQNPSVTTPVKVQIWDTVRTIIWPLNIIINAWSNYFNLWSSELATKEVDFFVYLKYNTSDTHINMIISRIPYWVVWSDFIFDSLNEKWTLWNTNNVSTDKVINIGRFSAILSAGAWYTWSTPSAWFQVINHHINESKWLDWVPTPWTIWSMTYSWVTYSYAKYKIVSNSIFFTINWIWTTWWTASKYISSTLPFTSNFPLYAWTVVNDWSWDIWGAILINNASNILYTYRYDWVNYWLWASRTIKGTNSYTI